MKRTNPYLSKTGQQTMASPLETRQVRRQISWHRDTSLPWSSRQKGHTPVSQTHFNLPPPNLFSQTCCHLRRFFCFPSSRKPKSTNQHHHRPPAAHPSTSARPFPSLLFRAVRDERTPGTPPRTKVRWCVVATLDGLAECVQAVVSTDDAELYVHLHHEHSSGPVPTPARSRVDWLVVHLRGGTGSSTTAGAVYIIDLPLLGRAGLEARGMFSVAQLEASYRHAATTRTSADASTLFEREGTSLEVGRLPSFRGLLESPAISKVCFDALPVVSALGREYGIAMRGVGDVRIMELAGRRSRSLSGSGSGWGELESQLGYRKRDAREKVRPRDLRTCLE